MEFKIDTRQSYVLITPLTGLICANLTDAIAQKQADLGQSVSQNLLIDLSECTEADDSALPALHIMHENFYNNGHSLVFTGLNESIAKKLGEEEDASLNIAPTMAEAIDIINMEILERDLFAEE